MPETSRWVEWEADRVAAHFGVDPAVGLDKEEAERRLKSVGPNRLSEGKKISPFIAFLNQFKDFMVLVLLAGGFRLEKREVSPRRSEALRRLLEIGVLCNNAVLIREEGNGMLRRKKA